MATISSQAAPPVPVGGEAKPRPPRSLRVHILGAVIPPVVLLAGVMLALFGFAGNRIAEQLGASLMESAASRVRADVAHFLGDAVRVSDLFARRVATGSLPTSGLEAWERAELDAIVTEPNVASVCFGAPDGSATWVLRRDGYLEVGRVDGKPGSASEFAIEPGGRVQEPARRTYQYDPRERPWYRAALAGNAPMWTPVYFWYGESGGSVETGTGYTRPIGSADGSVAGVLVIDVTLGGVSSFLRSLPLAQTGSIFIVDESGMLVGASHGAVNSTEGKRLALAESDSAAARAIAPEFSRIEQGGMARCDVGGEPSRVRAAGLSPYRGVNWRVITVVPESAFLGEAHAVRRHALWASGAALAGGLVLGIIMARRLASPLLELAGHARRLGSGDLEARIQLHQAKELSELSDELNKMAAGLKERLELRHAMSLAVEVQQSLLPQKPPSIAGLDVAGSSRYCEAAGGDDFDFLEVADLPQGHVLVAVGDVMGHGIAAALLMATARAALRAQSAAGAPLGEIMKRVNSVLAKDARHGRFMTMLLAVVDPVTRGVRWASAGHDAPMVYCPGDDSFREVEGGDVPLGIMDGVEYEEYVIDGLPHGAVLLIGTDGIWEAANGERQLFGKDRLKELIRKHAKGSSAAMLKAVEDALTVFCGDRPAGDDITAVAVRFAEIQATAPDAKP